MANAFNLRTHRRVGDVPEIPSYQKIDRVGDGDSGVCRILSGASPDSDAACGARPDHPNTVRSRLAPGTHIGPSDPSFRHLARGRRMRRPYIPLGSATRGAPHRDVQAAHPISSTSLATESRS